MNIDFYKLKLAKAFIKELNRGKLMNQLEWANLPDSYISVALPPISKMVYHTAPSALFLLNVFTIKSQTGHLVQAKYSACS